MSKKTIAVADIKSQLDQVRAKISELALEEKILQRLLSSADCGDTSTKRQKPNSKYRQALEILSHYSDGLTIKQLIEKAAEKNVQLKPTTLMSQFSKEATSKNSEITRKEDGRWIVSFYG